MQLKRKKSKQAIAITMPTSIWVLRVKSIKNKASLPQPQTSFFHKIIKICLLLQPLPRWSKNIHPWFQAPVIQGGVRGLAGVPLLPQPQLEAATGPPGGHQGPRLAIEVTTVMITDDKT